MPETGGGVVPKHQSQRVLTKGQELDEIEHRMCPFIEKCESVKRAIEEYRSDLAIRHHCAQSCSRSRNSSYQFSTMRMEGGATSSSPSPTGVVITKRWPSAETS